MVAGKTSILAANFEIGFLMTVAFETTNSDSVFDVGVINQLCIVSHRLQNQGFHSF
jgi:hypothetical protein